MIPARCSTGCGTRTVTPAKRGMSLTSLNSPRRPKPRSPAASNMSICSARRRIFPADFLPDGNPQTSIARNLNFTPKSGSVGLIQNLPYDLVGSITAQYVERAPKPAELFSRGAHDATATFDIGNPNLTIETAKSVEVGLRRATGPLRFEATAYYTKFDGFIFRRLTGNTCDESSCVDPATGTLELNQAVYSQRDATFRGGEFQFQWDTLPMWNGFWGVDGQYDFV